MALFGVAGHHDVLGRLLDIFLQRHFLPLADVHHALAVGNARAHPQQHRRVILLAQFKCGPGKSVSFRGISRLQHRHLRRYGIMPGVLFILAGMHGRVIRHAYHHTARHTRIAQGKQRVSRHVQSNVLHGADAPHTGQARAESRFHGHLFIGRPFAVDIVMLCQEFRDLRARGPRIAAHQPDSAVVKAPGHRFITN